MNTVVINIQSNFNYKKKPHWNVRLFFHPFRWINWSVRPRTAPGVTESVVVYEHDDVIVSRIIRTLRLCLSVAASEGI